MVDWAGERVLITGATGFIGRHLTRRLAEDSAEVWAGVYPGELPERAASLPPQVEHVPLDVQDAQSVRRAVEIAAPDLVFHLVAVGVTEPGVNPALALVVNAGGTVHLLEALRKRAVRRVVLVGTCHEYGASQQPAVGGRQVAIEGLDPFNAYAASKVAAWAFGRMYWRAHGLPVVTVRPFQVYGPGQPSHTLIPAAIRAALAGENFPMTPGEQKRDFIYVEDVVEGMMTAAQAPGIEGQSLDLGTGQTHTVRHAVEHIWTITEARGHILAGALPYRSGEVMHLVADADRTAQLIDWQAQVGLEKGLKHTIIKIQDDSR
ncbi:MAG: NAD(P)-dependent oxidoreductase [Chloroflexota bacterium]|nr:NAD(P)-dependent oxidoreductase [Chloroflexota bacterium]